MSCWDEFNVPIFEDFGTIVKIIEFIEQAISKFESCMIVSVANKCKAVVIATIFLMFKYKWSLQKTFEYLNNRKADLEMTKGLVKQLSRLEKLILSRVRQESGLKSFRLRADWDIGTLSHTFRDNTITDSNFIRLNY